MKKKVVVLTVAILSWTICSSACSTSHKMEVDEARLESDGSLTVQLSPDQAEHSALKPQRISTERGRFIRGEPLVNESIWSAIGWPTPKEHVLRYFGESYYLEP